MDCVEIPPGTHEHGLCYRMLSAPLPLHHAPGERTSPRCGACRCWDALAHFHGDTSVPGEGQHIREGDSVQNELPLPSLLISMYILLLICIQR